jgi:plastocyanin
MNRGTRAALVALGCGALAGLPALARAQQQDAAGSFAARDLTDAPFGHWDANHDESSSTITVHAGDTVAFSYPMGASHHNVVFNTAAKPSSCTGLPPDQFPAWAPGWSGSCRFDRAGAYPFVCAVHPQMTGTVTVIDAATPTPTAPPGATPTPTPGGNPYPTPTPTPTADPPQSTLRGAVKLASRQTGTRVRGSVQVKAARSRLEVAVSARLPGHRKAARVGHARKTVSRAGRAAFAVPLSAKARGALRKRHRLRLAVTVALTPPGGHKLSRTLHTTLRRG